MCVCVCVCVYVYTLSCLMKCIRLIQVMSFSIPNTFSYSYPPSLPLPLLCYLPPFPSPLPLNSHISSFFSSLQKLLAICVCVWTTMVSIPDNLHRMSWEVPVYPAINIRYLQPSLIRRRTHTHSILTTHRQSDRRTTHTHTHMFFYPVSDRSQISRGKDIRCTLR